MKPILFALLLPFLLFMGLMLWSIWSLAFDPVADSEFTMKQKSMYCIDCHDGVLATHVHRGHAVDTNYLLAQMKSRGKLKPPASLDSAIFLNDGQIVCTTCHRPDSPHESKLTISNVGSKLCLACHNL